MRGLDHKFQRSSAVAYPADVGEDDWRGKDDARTLVSAEEIKMHPERHARAKAHLVKQHMAVKKAARAPGPAPHSDAHDLVSKGYRKL